MLEDIREPLMHHDNCSNEVKLLCSRMQFDLMYLQMKVKNQGDVDTVCIDCDDHPKGLEKYE